MVNEETLRKSIAKFKVELGELISKFEEENGAASSVSISIVLQELSDKVLGLKSIGADIEVEYNESLFADECDDGFDDSFLGIHKYSKDETKYSQDMASRLLKVPESSELLRLQDKIERLKTVSKKREAFSQLLSIASLAYEKYLNILETGGKKVIENYFWQYFEALKSMIKATTALQNKNEFEKFLKYYVAFNEHVLSSDGDVVDDEVNEYRKNYDLTGNIYHAIKKEGECIQKELSNLLGHSGHAVRYRVENSELWGVIKRRKAKNSYILTLDEGQLVL